MHTGRKACSQPGLQVCVCTATPGSTVCTPVSAPPRPSRSPSCRPSIGPNLRRAKRVAGSIARGHASTRLADSNPHPHPLLHSIPRRAALQAARDVAARTQMHSLHSCKAMLLVPAPAPVCVATATAHLVRMSCEGRAPLARPPLARPPLPMLSDSCCPSDDSRGPEWPASSVPLPLCGPPFKANGLTTRPASAAPSFAASACAAAARRLRLRQRSAAAAAARAAHPRTEPTTAHTQPGVPPRSLLGAGGGASALKHSDVTPLRM